MTTNHFGIKTQLPRVATRHLFEEGPLLHVGINNHGTITIVYPGRGQYDIRLERFEEVLTKAPDRPFFRMGLGMHIVSVCKQDCEEVLRAAKNARAQREFLLKQRAKTLQQG